MSNATFLQVLRQLAPKERDELLAWADCSAHNRRAEVGLLLAYCCGQLAKKSARDFSAERLFAAAFPKQKYDNRKLRHTMSYALDLVRNYLVFKESQTDEGTSAVLLQRALRARGMDDFFEKEHSKHLRLQEQSERRDALWQLAQYQLLQEQLEAVSLRERSSKLDLRPLHDHLTAFYLAEMLRHATSSLTHQAISGQSYDLELLRQAMGLAEQGNWRTAFPPIAVYFHAVKALFEPEETAHFLAWKSALLEHKARFPKEELRSIYLAGINFCIRRLNAGLRQFIQEAFDLYRAALEGDLLFEKGYLTGFTFKNIIRIASALGEEAWVSDFFQHYETKLHPRERQSLLLYNRAYLHFQKGEYAEAMPMLQQTDLEDRLNLLDARRMLLRSYYELGEWQALESLLDSFSAYLRRQKDLGYHKEMYLNLIRFVRRLIEGKTLSIKEIEQTENVAERAWLKGLLEK